MKGEKVDSFMGSNKEKLAEFCVKMSKMAAVPMNKVPRDVGSATHDQEVADSERHP